MYEQTIGLFSNVRTISHELHPSVLRHAGLVAALRSFCEGTRDRLGITVHVAGIITSPFPQDNNVAYVKLPFLQQASRTGLGVVTVLLSPEPAQRVLPPSRNAAAWLREVME